MQDNQQERIKLRKGYIPPTLVGYIWIVFSLILITHSLAFAAQFHLWAPLPDVWIPEMPEPSFSPLVKLEQVGFAFAVIIASILIIRLLIYALDTWAEKKIHALGLSADGKTDIKKKLECNVRNRHGNILFGVSLFSFMGLAGALVAVIELLHVSRYIIFLAYLGMLIPPIAYAVLAVRNVCNTVKAQRHRSLNGADVSLLAFGSDNSLEPQPEFGAARGVWQSPAPVLPSAPPPDAELDSAMGMQQAPRVYPEVGHPRISYAGSLQQPTPSLPANPPGSAPLVGMQMYPSIDSKVLFRK